MSKKALKSFLNVWHFPPPLYTSNRIILVWNNRSPVVLQFLGALRAHRGPAQYQFFSHLSYYQLLNLFILGFFLYSKMCGVLHFMASFQLSWIWRNEKWEIETGWGFHLRLLFQSAAWDNPRCLFFHFQGLKASLLCAL